METFTITLNDSRTLEVERGIRSESSFMIIEKTGELSTGGVYYAPHVRFVARSGNYMLLHVPTHKAWSGQAQPWHTVSAHFMFCHIIKREGREFMWEEFTVETRHSSRYQYIKRFLFDYLDEATDDQG